MTHAIYASPTQDALSRMGTETVTSIGRGLGQSVRDILATPRTEAGDVTIHGVLAVARKLDEIEAICREARHNLIAVAGAQMSHGDVASSVGCSTKTVSNDRSRIRHITSALPTDFTLGDDGRWYLSQD